jgi:hypothetical protein|tara:strand:+ start:449 stop:811 length:363 start_codon:yes stop_codon:yes gene_type:complete
MMNIRLNTREEALIKEVLENYLETSQGGKGKTYNAAADILNKINESGLIREQRTPKVLLRKQYMFTFEEGGWNTVWAKTKRGAIKAALLEYKDSETLNVNIESIHLATEKGLESAMSLFY